MIKETAAEINNGIAWDFNDRVYVADTFAKKIIVYRLDLKADRSERIKFV